jgi:hypothetical protein
MVFFLDRNVILNIGTKQKQQAKQKSEQNKIAGKTKKRTKQK